MVGRRARLRRERRTTSSTLSRGSVVLGRIEILVRTDGTSHVTIDNEIPLPKAKEVLVEAAGRLDARAFKGRALAELSASKHSIVPPHSAGLQGAGGRLAT